MFEKLLIKYFVLDPVDLNPGTGGDSIGSDRIGSVHYEVVKQAFGAVGDLTLVSPADPLPVVQPKPAASSVTSVNDSASSQTLLAANGSRLGAMIFNDSSEILYLKLGATATTSSFTVKMVAGAYYEVPYNYLGIIDGIWANNSSGAARITELTLT